MKAPTLRQTSFVAYFSHLPPDEGIDNCAKLQGATEICSDVDNWKSYVAKRYGLKYSLQRPDLTTTSEWQLQALALEQPNSVIVPYQHNYVATASRGESPVFQSSDDHRKYNAANPGALYRIESRITVSVPGIPIDINYKTLDVTFHVRFFQIGGPSSQLAPAFDIKHPNRDSTVFESASLCHDWMLELLIPYYSKYLELGYTSVVINSGVVDANGEFTERRSIATLDDILKKLDEIFSIKNQRFDVDISMTIPESQEPTTYNKLSQRMIIILGYLAAKVSQ